MAEYKDFEISITGDGRKYFAQVLHSPVGESAPVPLELPFDQDQILVRLENAILRSVTPVRSGTRLQADLRNIGDALFRSLLLNSQEIGALYTGSRTVLSREGNARLRVKLRIDAEPLGALPWEYCYDDLVVKDYLGLNAQTSLVRYMQMAQPVRELAVEGPLRILGMVSNPRASEEYQKLDVTEERMRIDKAIHTLHEQGAIDFQWVRGESHNDLFEAMFRGPWHIFHFIGHGGVDEAGEGFLVLADEVGGAEGLTGTKLMRLLRCEEALRLVVLNCCDSARGSASLARSLVYAGIPAVLAMQFPISDHAAIELASGFYLALASGEPVDGAVTSARIKMNRRSETEWGIPVLYMRAPDGRIFSKEVGQGPPRAAPSTATRRERPALPVRPEPAGGVAEPGAVGASGFDLGDFSALEEKIDERDALAASFFADVEWNALDEDALARMIRSGEELREHGPQDERLEPRLARAHFHLGRIYQSQNSLNKAFVNISAAIVLDPTEPEYLYARANIFARGDQFEHAIADIDAAIRRAPGSGELHWAKGVICLLGGRTDVRRDQLAVAVEAFSAAIERDPRQAKFYSSRGAAYTRLDALPAALADLDKALELDPRDAKSHYHRGLLRGRLGEVEAAIEDFRLAVQLGYRQANAELQRLHAAGGRA